MKNLDVMHSWKSMEYRLSLSEAEAILLKSACAMPIHRKKETPMRVLRTVLASAALVVMMSVLGGEAFAVCATLPCPCQITNTCPKPTPTTGITIEAVDKYSCGALSNNIANVDNFRDRMLSIPGYMAGVRYTNDAVYPTDFMDPEVVSGGADTSNFDRPGDYIAYFSGHGTCDDQTTTACTSTASCPDISGLQKRCLRHTDSPLSGRCVYSRPRNIVVDKTGTSCQNVDYSNSVRWGEDQSAGSWAGAGTNGGINFAVIDNSCGITPDLYRPQLQNAFAGISTIALIMPTRVGSDTFDVANRGRAFADRYVANPNSAIAPSWADAINSVTGGSSCAFGGGNHGIAGCGAHIAISVDLYQGWAEWNNRTETWVQLRDEANDSRGRDWMYWIYTCNYDCNNHPFILP